MSDPFTTHSLVLRDFMRDKTIPSTVRDAIWLHAVCPWIDYFSVALISPLQPGLEAHFYGAFARAEGRDWYLPSKHFWGEHAEKCHPSPLGPGAGADHLAHVKLLTPESGEAKFMYAAVIAGGRLRVLGESNFREECAWWERNFLSWQGTGKG